jgi:hypothetical protein
MDAAGLAGTVVPYVGTIDNGCSSWEGTATSSRATLLSLSHP